MVTGARASITERDLSVLRFVGEQYTVPMAVVGQLVDPDGTLAPGSVATVARRAAGRLEQLGYAGRRPLLGQQWLIPTRTGLRAAGLDYRAEVPAESLLRHVATVARLRLHLAAAEPTAEWESERSIRRQWGDTRVRRVDGALARTSIIRYDAYGGTGGHQSASVALLDSARSGVILSAIQGRDYARIYVKELVRGKAAVTLSPEEQEAVERAMSGS